MGFRCISGGVMLVALFLSWNAAAASLPEAAPYGDDVYRYLDDPRKLGEGQVEPHVLLRPYADAAAAAEGGEQTPYTLTLDGEWKLAMAKHPRDVPRGFQDPDFDVGGWRSVRVPHTLQTDGLDHPVFRNTAVELWPDDPPHAPRDVNPTAAYVREFDLPAHWARRETFLRFEGATSAYFVWVNGRYAGYDQGGYTPAEFDISAALKPGKNRVAVQLHRWSAGSYLEDYDQWRYSGLFRSVWLYSAPPTRIRDAWIRTDLDPDYRDAVLNARILLDREAATAGSVLGIHASLRDAKGREVAYGRARAGADEVELRIPVRNPDKWSDETPALYTLVLTLHGANGTPLHATRETIGFREIAIRDRQLLVNGKRVLIKGTNRAETDPDHGRYVPRERQLRDVRLMKQLHINAVRTSHYPSDPYFYELADRHGLWLADEMEVETHAYEHCPKNCLADREEWHDAFLDRFKAMVARDRNHPSVLLWDTGNEAGLGAAHFRMAEWARVHEPSRPLYHQSNFPDGDAPFATVAGPRYPSLARLREIARDAVKPVILGEYAHAMGNSLGNFRELWEVIRANPHMQGGFIWDWAEQNIRQPLRMVADSSGNGIPAHLIGMPGLVDGVRAGGRPGKALSFSGLDDFVEVYRDPALDIAGKALTLDAWIRPARPWTGEFTIISKGDSQYALRMQDEKTLRFVLNIDGHAQQLDGAMPATAFDAWHRVTAVYDGARMRLHVDGRLVSSRAQTGNIRRNHREVNIGRDPQRMQDTYTGRMTHGLIDQVRIHDRALTLQQLASGDDPGGAVLALDFDAIEQRGTHLSYGESLSGVDGLVGADRDLQPEVAQMAWVHQPLRFAFQDGVLTVHNEQAFAGTEGLDLHWQVVEGRRVVASGRQPLQVAAGATARLRPQLPANPGDVERWLDVNVVTTADRPLIAAGSVFAHDQFALGGSRVPGTDLPSPDRDAGRLAIVENAADLIVSGTGFRYRFDKAGGTLASMKVRGEDLLHAGIGLGAWRAPNSNETYAWGAEEGKAWRVAGLDRLHGRNRSVEVGRDGTQSVTIVMRNHVAAADVADAWFEQTLRFRIDAAGTIRLEQQVSPRGAMRKLPYLPRIGVTIPVPDRYRHFAWHGRKLESYNDRKDGTPIGVWTSTVDEQYVDYHRPQDHGNHTDARWALLTDRKRGGVLVLGANDVSVTPYDQLDRAAYPYQRRRNDGWITLHADHKVTGVGDTPNPVLPQYQVAADADYRHELVIRPLNAEEIDAALPAGVPQP